MNIKPKEKVVRGELEKKIDSKEKTRREMSAVTSSAKSEVTLGHGALYDQCFSETDFQSQYEEECPVNYSLKYSETESSCKTGKAETPKEKFKDFSEYGGTDIDASRDFSFEYAEETSRVSSIKRPDFNYFEADKDEYKEYTDYAETDLDQPTDFTLKYGESSDEENKTPAFDYYKMETQKSSENFGDRREGEEVPGRQTGEHFVCEDETPLMFSRCSSLNSLSSFEHITQSIPDDRSSIVSEFSRTTSGIISPSELPDSPTQTAPSSPKRGKSLCFPVPPVSQQKKSVFEDDVASYKQEDTPIEFSRATSLSSLNVENPAKTEFNLKTNSKASSITGGGDDQKNKYDEYFMAAQSDTAEIKVKTSSKKPESKLEKIEVVLNEDVGDILTNCINTIQIEDASPTTSRDDLDLSEVITSHVAPSTSPNRNQRMTTKVEFQLSPASHSIFAGADVYEASDDDVHAYHTEGTPASVSHTGSITEPNVSKAARSSVSLARSESVVEPLPAKVEFQLDPTIHLIFPSSTYEASDDDVHTYHTEGTPANISHAGSHLDLSSLSIVSGISPSATANESDAESFCSGSEEALLSDFNQLQLAEKDKVVSSKVGQDLVTNNRMTSEVNGLKAANAPDAYFEPQAQFDYSEGEKLHRNVKPEPSLFQPNIHFNYNAASFSCPTVNSIDPSVSLVRFPAHKNQSLQSLPTSQNVLIRPKMPIMTTQMKDDRVFNNGVRDFVAKHAVNTTYASPKPRLPVPLGPTYGPNASSKPVNSAENKVMSSRQPVPTRALDMESWCSQPCLPLDDVLVEQCIRLGMPSKNNSKRLPVGGYGRSVENWYAKSCTPLEEALVEQCIRLGMPQKGRKPERTNVTPHACGSSYTPGLAPQHIARPQPPAAATYNWGGEFCTPFEEALVEQCIRLGMPHKNGLSRRMENPRVAAHGREELVKVASVGTQLGARVNGDELKKGRDAMKKLEKFVCNPGRRHTKMRKKPKELCKRCKRCKEKTKMEFSKS